MPWLPSHARTSRSGIGKDEPASVTVPVVRETGPASAFDLEGIQMLAQLWGNRLLPRDETARELGNELGCVH